MEPKNEENEQAAVVGGEIDAEKKASEHDTTEMKIEGVEEMNNQ